MAALATFSICVAIVLVFLIIVGLFLGPAIFLFVFIFPVLISEAITGERGTFSPNGGSKHSPLFTILTGFLAFVQVLLVAGVLFGIYWLLFGINPAQAPTAAEVALSRTILSSLAIYRLQIVNAVLWLLSSSFVLLLLFNTFRFWERVKQMPGHVIFVGYVLPLLMYPVACLFLASSRNYLTHYPNGDQYLGFLPKAAAILYCLYIAAFQIREVYMYSTVLQKHNIKLGLQYWLSTGMGLFYKILFVYFLVRIFMSL